jgi:hypothetical protein
MKKEFLKMAGVENEKDFYKLFPTEEAFFGMYPEAKKLIKAKNGGSYSGTYYQGTYFANGGQSKDDCPVGYYWDGQQCAECSGWYAALEILDPSGASAYSHPCGSLRQTFNDPNASGWDKSLAILGALPLGAGKIFKGVKGATTLAKTASAGKKATTAGKIVKGAVKGAKATAKGADYLVRPVRNIVDPINQYINPAARFTQGVISTVPKVTSNNKILSKVLPLTGEILDVANQNRRWNVGYNATLGPVVNQASNTFSQQQYAEGGDIYNNNNNNSMYYNRFMQKAGDGVEVLQRPREQDYDDPYMYQEALDAYEQALYQQYLSQQKAAAEQNTTQTTGSTSTTATGASATPTKSQRELVSYSGPSVWDFLTAQGLRGDLATRKQFAKQLGITGYKGDATQNAQLIDMFMKDPTLLDKYAEIAATVPVGTKGGGRKRKTTSGSGGRGATGYTGMTQEEMNEQIRKNPYVFQQSANQGNPWATWNQPQDGGQPSDDKYTTQIITDENGNQISVPVLRTDQGALTAPVINDEGSGTPSWLAPGLAVAGAGALGYGLYKGVRGAKGAAAIPGQGLIGYGRPLPIAQEAASVNQLLNKIATTGQYSADELRYLLKSGIPAQRIEELRRISLNVTPKGTATATKTASSVGQNIGKNLVNLATKYPKVTQAVRAGTQAFMSTPWLRTAGRIITRRQEGGQMGDTQNTGSLSNYLSSIGESSDFATKKRMAADLGITNYRGTSAQDRMILDELRGSVEGASSSYEIPTYNVGGNVPYYQIGGQPTEEEMMAMQQQEQAGGGEEEQVMSMVADLLSQQVSPEEIINELVNMNIPEETAMQIVSQVQQQMGGNTKMRKGGVSGKKLKVNQTLDVTPEEMEYLRQQGYDFDVI